MWSHYSKRAGMPALFENLLYPVLRTELDDPM